MKKRVLFYFLFVIISFLFNFYYRPIKGNELITDKYRDSDSYINDLYMSDEYFKEKLLDKSDYPMYRKMIEASLNNETEVTVECSSTDCAGSFMNAYYAIYLDHPELISFLGIGGYYDHTTSITYKNYNNLSKIKTYFGTKRIEREMENIRRDTNGMTDKEKIIYVYDYVASHQYDDLFTYIGSNQSAYSFFTKGNSVCAGFAKASQLIFQNIGIKSYLVLSSEHMWNYVDYQGKYYVFDATMGTSLYDKKSSYFYDGLGQTTIGSSTGLFTELYPKIEKVTLKELFKL